jgi:fructoselysine 3-epimerase
MIVKTLDFARDIGARNVSITSGRCLGGMPPDKAVEHFAQAIRPILDHADRVGVDLGIECEPGLLIEWVAELREWIERLNHPRFGANLDIGHSQVLGESITGVVRELGNRIWNLHVEDIPGRKHYHMIPGEGTLDWIGLRDALWAIKYERFATVELYTHTADPHAAARQSYGYLSKLFGT